VAQFLAHPVATIARIRQFLGDILTVVQGNFLPLLHCLSSAMHLFSSSGIEWRQMFVQKCKTCDSCGVHKHTQPQELAKNV